MFFGVRFYGFSIARGSCRLSVNVITQDCRWHEATGTVISSYMFLHWVGHIQQYWFQINTNPPIGSCRDTLFSTSPHTYCM